MMYLTAIFLSPLYFIINGKWGACLVNSVFYLLAIGLLLTFVLAFLAPIPWFIAAIHAIMDYRRRLVEEAATIMAQKLVEAMRQAPGATH